MANRYWVGGTGNWNTSNTANWSATSGGGGGASVPTSSDNAYFNGSSGAGTVTITSTVPCNDLDCTGFTGTIAGTNANTLDVYRDFILNASMTWACAVTINMRGSGTYLSLNGAVLGASSGTYAIVNITSGSTVNLGSAFSSPGVNFNITGGAFQMQGYSLTIADATRAGTFDLFQSGAAITLNAAVTAKRVVLYVGNTTPVGFSSASFVTRDFNTNLLTLPIRTVNSITLDAAAFGETDVLFTDSSAGSGRYLYPSTLTVQNSYNCTFYTDAYASSSFSAIGISAAPGSRLTVKSDTTTQRYITANAGTLQNTDFQYIYANGSTIPWTGTSLGDLGNNTNITFNYSPPSTGSGLFFAGTF
jgi:hypothetical protein